MKRLKLEANPELELFVDFYALVDDEDYERLNQYKWEVDICRKVIIVQRFITHPDGRVTANTLHREIMSFPVGMDVHHKNANRLDNRKCNLEILEPSVHRKLPRLYNKKARLNYMIFIPPAFDTINVSSPRYLRREATKAKRLARGDVKIGKISQ